jgi:hypothetical protein
VHRIEDTFLTLHKLEQDELSSVIPADAGGKVALLLDVLRTLDYLSVREVLVRADDSAGVHDAQIMLWGWNYLAGMLLAPLSDTRGMPSIHDDGSRSAWAATFLHQAGRSCLLKRTADMVRLGLVSVTKTCDGFDIRTNGDDFSAQFTDQMENDRLDRIYKLLDGTASGSQNGWTLYDREAIDNPERIPGAFMSRNMDLDARPVNESQLNAIMAPPFFPWTCGVWRSSPGRRLLHVRRNSVRQ